MDDDARFFYDNAGWSHGPDETPEQGRERGARLLADAERFAIASGWTIEWEDDWMVGDHVVEYDCYEDGGPDTCESAILRDASGEVLAALGCIDDADDDYHRVVFAELAAEAIVLLILIGSAV